MSVPDRAETHYLACAERAGGGAAGSARRRAAVEAFFRGGGFPSPSDEDWRFSGLDLTTALYRPFEPAGNGSADRARPETSPAAALPEWTGSFAAGVRFVDGRLVDGRLVDDRLPAGRPTGSPGSARTEAAVRGFGNAEAAANAEGPDPEAAAAAGNRVGPAGDFDWPGAHPLETLNAALFDCGASVAAPAEADGPPVLLYSLRSGGAPEARPAADRSGTGPPPRMLHPRFRTRLAPGSRATLVEVHDGAPPPTGEPTGESAGEPAGWTNPTSTCLVGENAELHYLRLDLEPANIAHTGRLTFELERNARVRCTVLSLGTGRSRVEVRALLRGEGAEADLNGLFLGVGAGKADHHTLVVHAARHTVSRQLFKSILAEESSSVFDGKIVVTAGAAGADAGQANRTLLLSAAAETHTRPRLEINADEVKCAHGAAIGKLDEDALFYLRSRGLGAMDSREILIRAFAAEVIGRAGVEAVRELAEARLRAIRPHWSRERRRPA